jgi:hypothetical protein
MVSAKDRFTCAVSQAAQPSLFWLRQINVPNSTALMVLAELISALNG